MRLFKQLRWAYIDAGDDNYLLDTNTCWLHDGRGWILKRALLIIRKFAFICRLVKGLLLHAAHNLLIVRARRRLFAWILLMLFYFFRLAMGSLVTMDLVMGKKSLLILLCRLWSGFIIVSIWRLFGRTNCWLNVLPLIEICPYTFSFCFLLLLHVIGVFHNTLVINSTYRFAVWTFI